MDPFTIFGLAKTLLSAGPTLIKTVGGMFGDSASETAVRMADKIEQIDKSIVPFEVKQKHVANELNKLSPEELERMGKVQVELAKIEAEREARQLEHQETIFATGQQTIQAGDKSQSKKVAACRPNLAYISAISGSLYVLGAEGLQAFSKGDGADMVIAGIMFALATAYMGIRHREKGQGTAT
ncbi:hypothetical protein [Photobacterium sp.]|uniref:hypothetical protein n=1 Tax=Photobacterium sp. TaxID=660 RepID=UPI00299F1F4B|nr:hypothetical protein [Photobacterium sp.]MDX1301206.1 hypothetical protein [Photobacterium sp.]